MFKLNRFSTLIEALPELASCHSPTSYTYQLLKEIAKNEANVRFSSTCCGPQDLSPFGCIEFPYYSMGSISSLDLFGLDELIIFSFYWANRGRYKNVVDIGANIGLHSLILDRCGYKVRAFEPDPRHYDLLSANLKRNGCANVEAIAAAVSDREGDLEFVRVLGNTTGSHLAGSKPNPYGELDRFAVKLVDIESIMSWADFIKLDAEGHERQILLATTYEQWIGTDAMVEVGSKDNADAIYAHFNDKNVYMYSQKNNWQRVLKPSQMPTSYREGSLFITLNTIVPWK